MNTNNGKYFFIPDWLLQENSQTIHAYIYILNEINSNGGELKTSYRNLAKELNLSLQNVRTIIKALTQKQTHNITQQSTQSKTLLGIDFIGVMDGLKKRNNTATDTLVTQITTNNQPANSFNFRTSLIDYGFKKDLVDDWLKVRKTKRATNTETAFKSFISEIKSRQCDINEMLQTSVTNSWSGFKHKWVDNLKNINQPDKPKEEKIGRTSIETIKKNAEYNGKY
jgi:hypothetical protein